MALVRAVLWVIPIFVLCQPTVYGMAYSTYSSTCAGGTCGVNAQCTVSGGRPVCSCLPGYEGDPLSVCKKVECSDHTECRGHLACQNNKCVNPCAGACGNNANCDVRNHVPVCSCPTQYTGNPISGCRLMNPDELCHPSPCGQNTKCDVINNVPTCSCLPGYQGSPLSGCRHECESDGECGPQQHCQQYKCVNPCSQCGINAECETVRSHVATCKCPKGYFGDPYRSCQAECVTNSDCPNYKPSCVYNQCVDPCKGSCGHQANCQLRGATPICSCPKDMTGDPFVSCRPFEKRDLCEPNPCGANAKCQAGHDNNNRERPVCTCLPGYVGNALTSCNRGECQYDEECPHNKACIGYSCVNPCRGQCGAGAECNARRHIAVCTCPNGSEGDALVACSTKRTSYPSSRYYRFW
ncbi:asperous [Arctopsyche grandis]|uniref:asperous n=1 Tax=Arctopsyche grandis TaxID=121162 RepID=UPI00406D6326